MKLLLRIFKAMANENRIKILEILYRKRQITILSLKKHLKLSESAVCKHLKILEQIGMVKSYRKNKRKFFTLNPKRVLRFNKKILKMIKQQRKKR